MNELVATVTKARAMSASLMTEEQFKHLEALDSISSASCFLRDNSDAGRFMQDVDTATIHRAELERILEHSCYDSYIRLYNFSFGGLKRFIGLLAQRYELSALRTSVRLINEEPTVRLSAVPSYILKNSDVPFSLISRASSGAEIYSLIEKSMWGITARPFLTSPAKKVNMPLFDAALTNNYYNMLYNSASECFCDDEAADVRKITVHCARDINGSRLARLKSFGAENIPSYLITIPGEDTSTPPSEPIERFAASLMRRSDTSFGIIWGYLLLRGCERRRAVSIIETIRYK